MNNYYYFTKVGVTNSVRLATPIRHVAFVAILLSVGICLALVAVLSSFQLIDFTEPYYGCHSEEAGADFPD